MVACVNEVEPTLRNKVYSWCRVESSEGVGRGSGDASVMHNTPKKFPTENTGYKGGLDISPLLGSLLNYLTWAYHICIDFTFEI